MLSYQWLIDIDNKIQKAAQQSVSATFHWIHIFIGVSPLLIYVDLYVLTFQSVWYWYHFHTFSDGQYISQVCSVAWLGVRLEFVGTCFDTNESIAQITPISFQTSIPHRRLQVRGMLQWLLNGHHHVCISYSQEYITAETEENLKWKAFTT